jgi:hypothetical protein
MSPSSAVTSASACSTLSRATSRTTTTPPDPEVTGEGTTALLDATANALVVSLHAVAGLQTENCMVIYVTIKGERLLTLLDTT